MAPLEESVKGETREGIMDSAERLFAEQGFDAVSLRMITADAGVNVAAVNYHFGSKDKLIYEVMARRIEPVNAGRMRMLDVVEARAAEQGAISVEAIIEALYLPLVTELETGSGSREVKLMLMGRCMAEVGSTVGDMLVGQFSEVRRRFVAAFQQAFPEASEAELELKLFFTVGVLIHTLRQSDNLAKFMNAKATAGLGIDVLMKEIGSYAAAGFRAGLKDVSEEARP